MFCDVNLKTLNGRSTINQPPFQLVLSHLVESCIKNITLTTFSGKKVNSTIPN
jgi:hypothetical protein